MGSWMNKDGLYIQYGTTKAVPETAGEYLTEHEGSRVLEVYVDMTALSSTPLIISNTVLWPATPTGKSDKFFIEQVEVVALVGATGGSGVNVGVINADRTTAMATTGASAFVNNLLVANIATAGNKVVLTKGGTVTGAGTYVPTPGNNHMSSHKEK